MSEVIEPRCVVEALMKGISEGAWKDLHEWYADDAVIDYPFALPAPTRLEGRAAIERYFAAASRLPLRLEVRDMVVHATADPEVVVAEWQYDGTVTTTGRKFFASNIQVSRVRSGKIVASRDYHNHAILAQVTGRLPAVIAAMDPDADCSGGDAR